MTVKERATTIAYADMLAVCELMQRMTRVWRDFMRGQTDFGDGAV